MKVIKLIIGILAALFAVAHVIGLTSALVMGQINFGSSFAASYIGGRVFGIFLGAAIAIACLRPKKAA